MPVEIRELIIRSTFHEGNAESVSEDSSIKKEQLIAECVDKVLQVLKEKQER